MTVPKSQSHTVYFDPLIKYYERPIKNVPSTAPNDTQYSQFFEAPEFDTMINRTLSDFRYMQKPRSFQEAYDDNIIENNIKITVENLFKPNGLFYIGKKPYTIIGVKTNPFNWQIDQKPLEKLLNQFSYLSIDQIQKQANEEINDIDLELRQGNIASTNITSDKNMSIIKSSLQDNSENLSDENIKKEFSGDVKTFIDASALTGNKDDSRNKLYTTYLHKNNPINYTNIPDLIRDPLTFSLLVKPVDLITFINTDPTKNKNLLDLYSAFITSKLNLKNVDDKYIEKCIEFAQQKEEFDKQMENSYESFIYKFEEEEEEKTEKGKILKKEELIKTVLNLKFNYMSFIFQLMDLINEIYTLQRVYFTATKSLLNEIKQNYTNIIQNYEEPILSIKCIENDILTFELLINEDEKNTSSKKYFSNYKIFKDKYNVLNTKKKDILEPKINYMDEIEFYLDNPVVIRIEMKQYEIYNFQMLLFYSYNQCDIWELLFNTIQKFTSDIFKKTTKIIISVNSSKFIVDNNVKYKKYKDKIIQNPVHIVIKNTDKKTKKHTWVLQDDDGNKIIKDYDKNGQDFQTFYIDYVKKSVNAYDAIILYIYLLEKYCLIQSRVYISNENIIRINIEVEKSLDNYYKLLLNNINYTDITKPPFIPSSFFWKTTKFNNNDEIKKEIGKKDKKIFIYFNRLRTIKQLREKILAKSEEFYKQITPNISKKAFIKQCDNIINKEETIIEPYYFGNTIDIIYNDISYYDIEKIDDFNYYMNKVINQVVNDRILDEDESVKSYVDWMVFKNKDFDNKSLYNAIADGLNRQLDLTKSTTNNEFTDIIHNKKRFTSTSLENIINKEASLSSININNIQEIILILEKTLGIKIIMFEMFKRPKTSDINVGDIVKNEAEKSPYSIDYRVILKNVSVTGNTYNLYDGFNILPDIQNKEETVSENVIDPLTGTITNMIKTINSINKNMTNHLEEFRVYCDTISVNDFKKYNDYIYIVATIKEKQTKFQLVRDIDNEYIVNRDKIPKYIRYLIFNSCPNLRDDAFFQDFKDKIDTNKNTDIEKEISKIEEQLIEKKKKKE